MPIIFPMVYNGLSLGLEYNVRMRKVIDEQFGGGAVNNRATRSTTSAMRRRRRAAGVQRQHGQKAWKKVKRSVINTPAALAISHSSVIFPSSRRPVPGGRSRRFEEKE